MLGSTVNIGVPAVVTTLKEFVNKKSESGCLNQVKIIMFIYLQVSLLKISVLIK